jgi:putative flippase GtrA
VAFGVVAIGFAVRFGVTNALAVALVGLDASVALTAGFEVTSASTFVVAFDLTFAAAGAFGRVSTTASVAASDALGFGCAFGLGVSVVDALVLVLTEDFADSEEKR